MLLCFLYVFLSATSTTLLGAMVKDVSIACSHDEFACADGACVSVDHICDGIVQCSDGSDEDNCYSSHDDILGSPVIRQKRQSGCGKSKWQCRDGSCISFDMKCDGAVDCKDGSDETHAICRKMKCQNNWFRCTYGACVDGTAPCNGVRECADGSDELLPRCRNDTMETRGQFRCADGAAIPAANHCDGVRDCADGSDETVRACAAKTCPGYLFQCAYGACVDSGADCNNVQDCADGSDEDPVLCDRIGGDTSPGVTTIAPTGTGNCVLPPYPAHGRYTVGGAPKASPGQRFSSVQLNVTCNPGYGVEGEGVVYCYDGSWSVQMPQCVRYCRLNKHPSVEYRCLISGNSVDGTRPCDTQEPSGTIVRPECNTPNYHYPGVLNYMRCIEGSWDYVAICTPECGRPTPGGEQLVIGGWSAKRGELPWHAGIYTKTSTPYMQICGGSLVKTTVVISAAHCFWNGLEEKAQPAANYAVAVGKLYRPWNNPRDTDAQKSDVSDIKIPQRFRGASANFQEDIAIMVLTIAFEYRTYVRPVCVDFEITFESKQLKEGHMGKVAGWGLTEENGNPSQVLKVVDLPFVNFPECYAESPSGFREYLTSDKICAGFRNGTALCKGDSGGGLVFPESDRGVERYYLRGVVSTAPNNDNLCNANAVTSFTQISKHERFIKEYVSFNHL